MRPSNKSRSRNKSGNPGGSLHNQQNRRPGGNIVNRVFDSAGPDGKVRGTPQQIIDKYLGLARDAQLGGDRVATESFLQHAEHYSRLLGEAQRQQNEQRAAGERDDGSREDGYRPEQREGAGRDDRQDRGPRQEAHDLAERIPSFSSGFATIDPEDVDDPRDRPHERPVTNQRANDSHRQDPPREPDVQPSLNGASHDAVERGEDTKPDLPKRTRTRRKAPPPAVPVAQAE